MEDDYNGKVKAPSKRKIRKPKRLEYLGWGSKNLIEFLESLGKDTTNRISEIDVRAIIMKYIREKNLENPSKKKTVVCDKKLRLLFGSKNVKKFKISELLEKHYVENQEDSVFNYLYSSGDDEQQRLCPSDKIATNKAVQKPKGTFAAIVSDNIKLVYLRKSLVQELAKDPETFESKVMGTFVKIKKPSYQLVQVTGVKEGNLVGGPLLQIRNYVEYLEDVHSSALSDDNFSQEECEDLRQRMKIGFVKRLTVVDMEEKVRILHEDVTKHWIARELVSLQGRINQANEKGWRRAATLSQYLEKRELLKTPEEQSRLLLEIPEIVAEEEVEPERVDDDDKTENDFIVTNPEVVSLEQPQPVSSVEKTLENSKIPKVEPECVDDDDKMETDFIESNPEAASHEQPVSSVEETLENSKIHEVEEHQPTWTASADDNGITENKYIITEGEMNTKDSITEGEMNTQHQPSGLMIDLNDEPQTESSRVEIIELSDDEDDEEDNDNRDHQHYDPEKVMWYYEYPKGKTHGIFSLTALKKWSDAGYFDDVPDFKVWMRGESPVLLTKLLPHIKT